MKSKYTALETKSKDLIAQQNHAVAGATIALSELGLRLSNLVDQLVSSYSISEQELEVNEKKIVNNYTQKSNRKGSISSNTKSFLFISFSYSHSHVCLTQK